MIGRSWLDRGWFLSGCSKLMFWLVLKLNFIQLKFNLPTPYLCHLATKQAWTKNIFFHLPSTAFAIFLLFLIIIKHFINRNNLLFVFVSQFDWNISMEQQELDEKLVEGRKAVKVKWKNEVFLFLKKKDAETKKSNLRCDEKVKGEWRKILSTPNRPKLSPHHHNFFPLASTLIVLCNVLFSALSWIFIFLVIPKNYFITFFSLLLFRNIQEKKLFFWGSCKRERDVDRRMYLLVSGISLIQNLFHFGEFFFDQKLEKGHVESSFFCVACSHFLLKVGEKVKLDRYESRWKKLKWWKDLDPFLLAFLNLPSTFLSLYLIWIIRIGSRMKMLWNELGKWRLSDVCWSINLKILRNFTFHNVPITYSILSFQKYSVFNKL